MRNILVGVILIIVFFLSLAFWVRQSGQRNSPIADLISAIQREDNTPKKQELLNQLATYVPSRNADFYVLAMVKETEIRKASLLAISNTNRFHGTLVKLVDKNPDNKELVSHVTKAISNLRNKDDVPALLKLVRQHNPRYYGRRRHGNFLTVIHWFGYKIRDAISARRHGDAPLLQAAATALIAIQDERAIDGLLDAEVFHVSPDIYPIARFGIKALPRLIAIAQNTTDPRCREAAFLIGEITDTQTIPDLIQLVSRDDAESELRAYALKALWTMRAREAETLTEKLLHDPSLNVQMRTVESLLRSDNAFALEKVMQRLAAANPSRDDLSTESRIIELLGEGRDFRHTAAVSKFLASRSSAVRGQAMEYLAKADLKSNLPAILELLEHPEWSVRREILQFLAEKKEKGVVLYAIKLLDDSSQWVRLEAGTYLAVVDYENHLPHILGLLDDPDHEVQGEVLKLLLEKQEIQAVPYAEKFLNDPHDDTRFTAAKLLEKTTGKIYSYRKTERTQELERYDRRYNPGFQELLKSPVASYRGMAVHAVTKANYEEYLPQILKLLDDPDEQVRTEVLRWLMERKEKRAIPHAAIILSSPRPYTRLIAIQYLAIVDREPYLSLIFSALDTLDVPLKVDALTFLSAIADRSAAPYVEKYVGDPNAEVRLAAIRCLAGVDYEKYLPRILQLCSDPDWQFKKGLLSLLAEKKEMRAVPYAEWLLEDSDDHVRFAAAKLLEVTTGKKYPYRQTEITQHLEKIFQREHPGR